MRVVGVDGAGVLDVLLRGEVGVVQQTGGIAAVVAGGQQQTAHQQVRVPRGRQQVQTHCLRRLRVHVPVVAIAARRHVALQTGEMSVINNNIKGGGNLTLT